MKTKSALKPLYSPWGENIVNSGAGEVLTEYPRPQMERDNYRILNGYWDCWFETVTGSSKTAPEKQKILVPFSPEALLSGVSRQLLPEEYLWYETSLHFSNEDLARKEKGMRCILHFGAVDQQATVFCNQSEVLSHAGGYLPFHAEITEFVSDVPCLLQVRVRDVSDTSWHSRGKQALENSGIFYTAQSGIWQTVWYEWVPANYIENLKITPDPDNRMVTIELCSPKEFSSISCIVYRAANYLATYTESGSLPPDSLPGHRTMALVGVSVQRDFEHPNVIRLILPEEFIALWTPEAPYLYNFTLLADNDKIHGYFALRSFTVEPDGKGILRFCLNHKPYFLNGLLDQGYWSDGLMTAPCDEAMIYDIGLARKLGFRMLRKHIKLEPLRWYYHCDRLGMIVWQDMVNGGTAYNTSFVTYLPTALPKLTGQMKDSQYKLLAREDAEGRAAWEQECLDTVSHLYSVPSIAVWTLFNEGWGQFDSLRITERVKELDPTRPVDHASGWFDQKGGDFRSVHNYFRPLKVKLDKNRAFVISEYGGLGYHIKEHSVTEQGFGYQKYTGTEDLNAAYQKLMSQLPALAEAGLSAAVYTQLSDVETEVNGLVTYDRRTIKIKNTEQNS